ncbi:ABC transporter substrate-binding protein [bacterium]|nr:ABC transporter substrate-binding protein [bacterium]
MKRILYIILSIIFLTICLKACIKRDIPPKERLNNRILKTDVTFKFPQESRNVVLGGVDYLQSQAPVGKFGGEMVVSTIGEGPKTFNPFTSKDAVSSSMSGLMFDSLFTISPNDGKVIPKLAKSYETKDGKKYIVHLRQGIKWSDGKPITADDVVFTWNKIILAGLGNTSTRDAVVIDGKLPKVTKIDNYTVKFEILKPFSPFIRLISVQIAPKHIFEPVTKQGARAFDMFYSTNTKPDNFVTSGAFRLKEYKAAQRVVFERNSDYYMLNKKNQKLPYLDKIIYLIVGDLNNEILKFEGHEIDVISLRGSNVAPYKIKEADSDYKIYNLGADTGTMFVAINLNPRRNSENKFYVDPKKQYWFSDKDFRTAIDYALDRKNMVQNIANGLAKPLFTAESLNSIFLNTKIKGHERNLKKAKEVLINAGFKYGNNKKLYDKFGNRVEFDLYTNAGNTEREAIGVMVKQDLEDLGMRVNFKPVEFNTLVNKMTTTFDWDMIIMGLTGSPLEPHDGLNVWHSKGSLHLFNQRTEDDKKDDRFTFEKRLDEIFESAALQTTFASRKKLYDEYQQIVYDEKPFIYLYSPVRMVAVRKKFRNIYPSQLLGITYNIEEIYKDKY